MEKKKDKLKTKGMMRTIMRMRTKTTMNNNK